MGLFEWCKDCKYEIKGGCVNTLHCVEGNKYLKDLSKSKCEDCANLKTVAIDGLRYMKICDFGKECIDRNLFRPKEIKADKIQPGYYHKGKVDTIKFCLENDLDNKNTENKFDVIKKAEHYNQGIEVIDIIESYNLDFSTANVIKYVLRAKYKGSYLQDLKKAQYYLERLIKNYEKGNKER